MRGTAVAVAASILVMSEGAHANIGQAYGFGSRTAGLAGAGVSLTDDSFAGYTNPAALGTLPFHGKSIRFSWGLTDMEPLFKPINGVVIENEFSSDEIVVGDVDTEYRATFGQFLALSYRPWADVSSFTFSIVSFLPLNQLAYMDTGETFIPEYILYRSRTQRPQFEFAGGGEIAGSGFSVGAGLHLAFTLTSNASLFMNSSSGKPSVMRFAASMKPKLAPYFGVLYASPQDREKLSGGLVVRLPVSSANKMTLNTDARLFEGFGALPFNFEANSALFYDPFTVEFGGAWRHTRSSTWHGRLLGQLSWEAWGKYDPPAIEILDPRLNCDAGAPCGIALSPTSIPSYPFRHIFIPRIAEEVTVGPTVYRAGYAYQPGILVDAPAGAGNYLDPGKHIITLGASFPVRSFTVDVHLAYHQLLTQTVSKAPGDEAGSGAGNLKIGAPGYEAGGKILGAGVSVSLAL